MAVRQTGFGSADGAVRRIVNQTEGGEKLHYSVLIEDTLSMSTLTAGTGAVTSGTEAAS